MKVFFRVSLAFVFCLLFVVSLTKPVLAQTTHNTLSNYTSTEVNPDVPQNIHSLTQIVTTEMVSTLICQLSGIDIINRNQSCLGIDPQTHRIGFTPNSHGLIGMMGTGILYTFNIPVHSGTYVQYMANRFGPTEHAFAQAPTTTKQTGGVGFTGLEPLLNIWTQFRNVVYLLFVIIFVLIGIAIMLRVQIDPRTVMTVENQLPKIVIGIILVTFSYAIAGFMVDMMWLLTFFVVNIVGAVDPATTASGQSVTNIATLNLLQGPLGFINNLFFVKDATGANNGVMNIAGAAANAIKDVVNNLITVNNTQSLTGGALPGATGTTPGTCNVWDHIVTFINPLEPNPLGCPNQTALSSIISGNVQSFIEIILGAVVGWVLGAIGFLIILIAILITMFRVWFTLLQAFAYIILDVILAPFYILAGLIPGSSLGFGSWFRGLAANLLVFPSAVFMFVLAKVLLDAFYGGQGAPGVGGGSLFEPPLIGSFQGNGVNSPLGAFVALAIFFATPEVLNIVRKALQVEDNGLGAAAMRSVGSGGAIPGRAGSGLWNMATSPTGVTYKPTGPGGRAEMFAENATWSKAKGFISGLRGR
ncbi:MAG TPA: hypothetical protein VLG12_02820 [Candidatus Saccharimonadales bacterium]|nr:hypothetical protein [Candidatus Saccharimonadales bacterium]